MMIYIFTEASSKYGYGHLTRCSALYDAASAMGLDVKLVVDSDNDIENITENRKYEIADWKRRINEYNLKGKYVIVDSYHATEQECEIILKQSEKVVFIDDYARIEYPGGLVINPALQCPEGLYQKKKTGKYLWGLDYVILRKPFEIKNERCVSKDVKQIFVSLGGSDVVEASHEIIEALNKCKLAGCTVNFVITKSYKQDEAYFESLNNKFGKKNLMIVHKDLSAQDMYRLMSDCDFAVSAAGQTIHELISVQLPFVCLRCAENQDNNISALQNLGIIKKSVDCISGGKTTLMHRMVDAINDIIAFNERKRQNEIMRDICIIGGCKRILKELLN